MIISTQSVVLFDVNGCCQYCQCDVTLQDDRKFSEVREDEGMGTADIKYGDTLVYVQHAKTGHWLSYQTFETKKRGVGRVEEKKVGTCSVCTP